MLSAARIDLHRLSVEEIVYAVYHDGTLVHVGESESIARAGQYVQALKGTLGSSVTAGYIEITSDIRSIFELPVSVSSSCLFRGNLERLLQAAFFARHGRLPLRDRTRGGKGTPPTATGGFIRGVHVLPEVFTLLDRLCPPKEGDQPWPSVNVTPPESIDPIVQAGRGGPGKRRRHLAFWADFQVRECLVGHLPELSSAPQYGAASKSVEWRTRVPTSSEV